MKQEFYIRKLLSVVQRNYVESELEQPLYVPRRAEDLMICVLEGESVYEIGGERLHLQAGDVLCLPRGCGYRRRVFDVNYKTVFVYFYYDAPDEALPPYQFWRATEGLDLHFLRLYKKWVAHDLSYQSDCMSIFIRSSVS